MAANIPFALAPGMATNAVIDYTTTSGQKVWDKATAKLAEEQFDCDSEGLRDFLELVRARAEVQGWNNSVLAIPVDIANQLGDAQDFLDHYGEIGLDHCRAHALTYYNQQNRAAQDSMQLYTCVMNSMSRIGRNKVTGFRDQYSINGTPCGILLLKVIVRESYIDTNATTSYIRGQLSSLDEYLPQVDYDIGKMNLHVQSLIEALNARGKTTTDLLTNLFKGYKSAKDENFVNYINLKEEYYEEGNALGANELMEFAKNKWSVLKQKHLWNAPSPQEEKILALEAKVKRLEQKKKTKRTSTKNSSNPQSATTSRRRNEEPWMLVPPKQDESQPKTVGGKPWWWCLKHKKWCRHTTEKCEERNLGGNKSTESSCGDNQNSGSQSKTKKKKQMVRALGAAAQDESESESEGEDEE
jgi:hypothetical protein